MRKYVLIILFCLHNLAAYNQLLKGKVCDAKTTTEIPFASIYFDGTFVGTTSDQYGRFELDRSNYPSMPVTISAIGYYSVTITVASKEVLPPIYLKPKEYALKETVVKTKSLVRRRKMYLDTFKAEFLGATHNAKSCNIVNEKDITFDYNSSIDTLKAYALKPIVVENKALGYTITYYLDKFEYYWLKRTVFFYGNIKFKEINTSVEMQNVQLENRKQAYLGSKMHFFRSLLNNDFNEQGFIILTPVSERLRVKDFVVSNSANQSFLHYPTRFNIWYKGKPTSLYFLKEYVYFDRTGYFDPSGIQWAGDMGDKRIADWLPYEYTIEK
ncbi:MAG: carboxypeptidase-like regulatory domain-containing protein [Paludibacter sp.]|nr:carboxypeptidase-like regulatory domain-containing protein [Paludibacter sp.]